MGDGGLGDGASPSDDGSISDAKDGTSSPDARVSEWAPVLVERGSFYSVSGYGDDFLVVAGSNIIHSRDRGASWQHPEPDFTVPLDVQLTGVWVGAEGLACVVGERTGVLHRTDDYGKTWTSHIIAPDIRFLGIWGNGSDDVYAVGASGSIYHSAEGCLTWEAQESNNTTAVWYGVWGIGQSVFVVGDDELDTKIAGTMIRTTDGGQTWKVVESVKRLYYPMVRVWGTSAKNVYTVGNAFILHTSDGETWQKVPVNSGSYFHGIGGTGPDDVYAAGFGDTIVRSTDGGNNFQRMFTNSNANLFGVWGTPDSTVYVVGFGNKPVILRRTPKL